MRKKFNPEAWINQWVSTHCEGPDDLVIIGEFLTRIYNETNDPMHIVFAILQYQNKDHTVSIAG